MKFKGIRPKRLRSIRRSERKKLERRLAHPKKGPTRPKWAPLPLTGAGYRWTPPIVQKVILAAPKTFSLVRAPEALLSHLDDISSEATSGKIIVSDMSDVEDFSTDALLCLIALSNDRDFYKGAVIQGKEPVDPIVKDKFRDSGIYGSTVRFASGIRRHAHGTIHRVNNKIVMGDFARDLIQFATLNLFGEIRPLKGVYTTMIECMNNTFNHAAEGSGVQQLWWATVYVDPDRKKAFFNFLDTGVGILESIKLKYKDRLSRFIGLKTNAEILREVFEGKIGSRTGLDYRGNGLPQIAKRLEMEQLSRLVIVTNNVYADLENDEFRILPKPFNGTFFHWEVSYDRHNHSIAHGD